MDRTATRLVTIWIAMMALTLSSFAASGSWFSHAEFGSASIIVLALIKVRFVVMDFMEVRHAPWLLRLILEVWIVCVGIALVVILS